MRVGCAVSCSIACLRHPTLSQPTSKLCHRKGLVGRRGALAVAAGCAPKEAAIGSILVAKHPLSPMSLNRPSTLAPGGACCRSGLCGAPSGTPHWARRIWRPSLKERHMHPVAVLAGPAGRILPRRPNYLRDPASRYPSFHARAREPSRLGADSGPHGRVHATNRQPRW